jgi:hypothetical protein
MASNGASFGQIQIAIAITVGLNAVGGAVLGPNATAVQRLLVGGMSGAAGGAIDTAINGGDLGSNMALGYVQGSVSAGFEIAMGNVVNVSQASEHGEAAGAGAKTEWKTNHAIVEAEIGPDGKVKIVAKGHTSVEFLGTTYAKGASPNDLSAYGRGTTKEDRAAGNTSLGFHEDRHATDVFRYVSDHPMPEPQVWDGMTVRQYNAAMGTYQRELNAYHRAISAYTRASTDCVGVPMKGC